MFENAVSLLEKAIEQDFFPSASVAVGCGNEVFLKATYGSASIYPIKKLANNDTYYDMASMTKIMATTMVAFKFIECGKLSLFDEISMFFDAPVDKQGITIMHLMTHTSGLPAHFLLQERTKDPDKAIETILQSKLNADIGKQVEYSCMGYILLGRILEIIGGEKLDSLAKKHVFIPLNMNSTQYLPFGDNIASTEYDAASGSYLKGVVHDENARFLKGVSGNAGLFSTLEDTVKYATMLSGCVLEKESCFISQPLFRQAVRNYTGNQKESRGLGFSLTSGIAAHAAGDLFTLGSFGHTGYTGTSLWVDIGTGLYVILLTNRVHYGRKNTKIIRFRRIFHNAVVSEYSNRLRLVDTGKGEQASV